MSSEKIEIMSLLWLKPGVTPSQAHDYFTRLLAPLIHAHGGEALPGFQRHVQGTMKGELKPEITDGFQFPSQRSLQDLLQDPEYRKIIPVRDAIFDMSRHTVFKIAALSNARN
jgi:uncharacterized protein (DUF1330 family)